MKTIFSPVIRILNLLSYIRKFILIGIILILPLSITLYLFVNELNSGVRFTQKELYGLEYNIALRGLMQHVQEHRGLSSAFLSGDTYFKAQMLDEELKIVDIVREIDGIDRKHGTILRTTEKWTLLRKNIENLNIHVWTMNMRDNFNIHTAISTDIVSLISYVGDTSNLILDPELDSFYLMHQIVEWIPRHTENMGKIRGLGAGAAAKGRISPDERDELKILYSFVKDSFDASKQGFQTAFSTNSRLKPGLEPALHKAENATNALLELLSKRIIYAQVIDIRSNEFFDTATESIHTNYALYDDASRELEILLNERIDRLLFKKNIAGLIGISAIFLSIYIFTGFYKSVVPPLRNLSDISQTIAAGDFSRRVITDSNDELGVVGKTVNKMTEAIKEKVSQLTALQEAVSDITATLEIERVLERLTQRAACLLRSELAAIVVLHPETDAIQYFKANIPPESFPVKKTPEGRGLWTVVAREGSAIRLDDLTMHPRFEGLPPEHPPVKNIIGLPIVQRGKLIGGVLVANKSGAGSYSQEDEDLLRTLTLQISSALDNARMHAVVSELATRDSLTGLNNRRVFKERLDEEITRAFRYNRPFSIMMLDLDKFKKVNDTYGHPAGDSVLQQSAKMILQQVRNCDFSARYGGEEFVVILPETSEENSVSVGERIRNAIAQHTFNLPDGKDIRITISIGIASFPANAMTAEKLIERSDQALYNVKQTGGNRVCVFSESAS